MTAEHWDQRTETQADLRSGRPQHDISFSHLKISPVYHLLDTGIERQLETIRFLACMQVVTQCFRSVSAFLLMPWDAVDTLIVDWLF